MYSDKKQRTMPAKATTPIFSEKVNPRTQCLTCGEFHSNPESEEVDIIISVKFGDVRLNHTVKTKISQCNKCLSVRGKPNKIWVRDFTLYGHKDRHKEFKFSDK